MTTRASSSSAPPSARRASSTASSGQVRRRFLSVRSSVICCRSSRQRSESARSFSCNSDTSPAENSGPSVLSDFIQSSRLHNRRRRSETTRSSLSAPARRRSRAAPESDVRSWVSISRLTRPSIGELRRRQIPLPRAGPESDPCELPPSEVGQSGPSGRVTIPNGPRIPRSGNVVTTARVVTLRIRTSITDAAPQQSQRIQAAADPAYLELPSRQPLPQLVL